MISIIIPVYNVKIKLLKRCIESIYQQTYDNFEIILVLNGCGDDYLQMLKKELGNKEKIRIVESDKGVSVARNYGIKIAQGEYITFVDGDDTLNNLFLEKGINTIKKYNLDWISEGFSWIYADKNKFMNIEKEVSIYSEKEKDLLKQHLLCYGKTLVLPELEDYYLSSVWGKIYKKQILDSIRFDEQLYKYEDLLFIMALIDKTSKAGVLSYNGYNYYQYKNSSLHKSDEKVVYNHFKLNEELEILCNNMDVKKANTYHFLRLIKEILRNYIDSNNKSRKMIKEAYLKKNKNAYKTIIIKNNEFLTKENKIYALVAKRKNWKLLLVATKTDLKIHKKKISELPKLIDC